MGRIACLLVADFPIAALIRANPERDGAVFAIARSLAPHAELEAAAPRARALGIRAGMTIAQARAISSALTVVNRSPAAESSAHSALLDAAESIAPVVEPGAPGCAWIDLAGLERIYRGEEEVAADAQRHVRRLRMECAVGVAANKELAHLAARCGGVRVIEAGREREFLDWLPLDMLELGKSERGDDLETTLKRWGLRRLGELARLNPDAVGTRLGRRGVELVRLARGGSSAPLAARRRAEIFVEETEFEYGIETLDPLGFVMRAMLERLVERIAIRGLVAGDVELVFGMDGHRTFSRRVAVAAPSNEVRSILTLINLSLEAAPPPAAVESIRIEIAPRAARPAQGDMFAPPAPAPDKLAATIARLAVLCGPGNVGMLSAENSHRPAAVRLDPFAPPPPPQTAQEPAARDVTHLVMRAIAPAREIEVLCAREQPEFVRGARMGGRVVSIAGPWRRDGEWWKGAVAAGGGGFVRDYYEMALEDGGVYRVFRDVTAERWFVDGAYD